MSTKPPPLSRPDYERFRPFVFRIAFGLARRPGALQDDLLACGWVGLLESRRRRPDLAGEEFENYASLRVRGAMLDHLRSLCSRAPGAPSTPRETPLGPLDSIEAPEAMPDEQIARARDLARLLEAMDALPSRLRRVLSLSYQQGRPLKEVGAALGVTESRASQLRSEALRRLRQASHP